TWRRLGAFFVVDFPRRLRAAWRELGVAALLFFVPALAGYLAGLESDTARQALVPETMRATMERGRTWTDIAPVIRPAMAAMLFTNNIAVSFTAFASGALFGLGTAYVLAFNGLFLGAVLGAAQHYGVGRLLL